MPNPEVAERAAPTPLQFDKAEFAAPAAARTCTRCTRTVGTEYFEANEKLVCPSCAAELRDSGSEDAPGSGFTRFLRALGFGAAGATVGAGLWMAVTLLTGWEIGLVAIVVGVVVGQAVKRGARARGGWLYQALAVMLTYLAIVSTYVPEAYTEITKAARADATTSAPAEAGAAASASAETEPAAEWIMVPLCLVLACALAFVAPFLAGLENVLGLLIIGFALYEAWVINRRTKLTLTGPFQVLPEQPPLRAAGTASAA